MTALTILIPWQPQPNVSPNSRKSNSTKLRGHQANTATAARAVRDHMERHADQWDVPKHPAMDITVFWGKGRNRQDLDNIIASCKGATDGVTRELGFDDRRLIAITVSQSRDPDGLGYTSYTIREATAEERRRAG